MTVYEVSRNGYLLSTDPRRLDRDTIHRFLRDEAYWSRGIPRDVVDRALDNSLTFGLYRETAQIGMARVVTDFATFAYVADVFVLPPYRGQGLATWMMRQLLAHPELQHLRRWLLLTRDAHRLYAQVGFTPAAHPERVMEITRPAKSLNP